MQAVVISIGKIIFRNILHMILSLACKTTTLHNLLPSNVQPWKLCLISLSLLFFFFILLFGEEKQMHLYTKGLKLLDKEKKVVKI